MQKEKKKDYLKRLVLIDNVPDHPRALREVYIEINIIFRPASTTSILQGRDLGVILIFRSHYLRNTVHKPIAAI